MVYARLKSPQAIRTYNRFAQYSLLVLIGFLVLGGFKLILPLVGLLYVLLGLPLPALTLADRRGIDKIDILPAHR